MIRLRPEDLEDFACNLLIKAGAREEDAAIQARQLLWASLRGHDSHGVGHLPLYAMMYLGEDPFGVGLPPVNTTGDWEVTRESASAASIDGKGCPGQVVTYHAAELAIRKAQETGVGGVTVSNMTHNGSLGYYAEMATQADCIGIVLTNSGAMSAPFGGADRMLGTNPVAIAVPGDEEGPLVIDMATTAISIFGALGLAGSGQAFPPRTVLDDNGDFTADTKEFALGRGSDPKGSLANLSGDHKGYAIQLAVEMIAGLLAGLCTGNDSMRTTLVSSFVLALHVPAFQDRDAFLHSVDSRLRAIRSSRKNNADGEILIPGDRGFRTEAERRQSGIPILDAYWAPMEGLARKLGVELPQALNASAS
ncbi:Ldh family oxidoreductase [Mycolicibacterium sp. YH-1]|jgi:L-2-hydroxycarboxylate dehydrogenase (NAD+)|uniref:Ldh family oxidoreductase n=1 Tax=Mycolicibacterium sp. YH-1 TaxID=2908837 RepID=UPI001F4C12BF|nr:Ldh family oxidoreductase [Mycolicibacterium sp. YH-1]UNB52160.1 Ldh family oxidoreductase [Mycolicibacterium sp. YH-1]